MHPQRWPEDLDLAGKRVVVIGSGATAATLIPCDSRESPARDDAAALPRPTSSPRPRNTSSPAQWSRSISPTSGCTRSCAGYVSQQQTLAGMSFKRPRAARVPHRVHAPAAARGLRIEHFTPRYRPWQRIAVVPDGDLFERAARGDVGRHRHHRDVHRALDKKGQLR